MTEPLADRPGAPATDLDPQPDRGPDGLPSSADPGQDPPPLTPRAITLAALTVLTSLLIAAASVLPLPYAVSGPGPTVDTLGEYKGVRLITIDGAETFEPSGELLMTTVSVAGGPGYPVTLSAVLQGWFDRTRSVSPAETVFSPDEDRDEIDERNQASMISSQENATVAALEELGYEVPTVLTVVEVLEGSGAVGVIEPEDVLTEIDGTPVLSFSELSARMDQVEPGQDVTVGLIRDGEPVDLEVTTTADGDRALLGVLIDPEFDLPVDVQIEIQDVGGPSAGTMFALGIIDTMTEVDETGGATVAGTGTMDLTGDVGPIGGIRQKLAGAVRDGATWFLAPEENCDEVVGHVPDGLTVVKVGTLHEARIALEAIGAGETDDLPACT